MRVLAVVSLAALARAQEACGPTPLYSVCDIVFDADPSEVTQLQAEMKSPKFRTSLVPAFHDGGRKWIIRFAPMDPGTYEFRITSNVARYSGKTGTVEATPSDHPGFIRPANFHHWIYPETIKPHLWIGGVNHVRLAVGEPRETERKIRESNASGKVVDLILPDWPTERREREAWVRGIVARFAAFDVTWILAERWEGKLGARAALKEIGELFKKHDPYNHPRGVGTKLSSSPLAGDGWLDYIAIGADSDALPSVEHQFFAKPFVTIAKARAGADAFRRQLWNATMSGQYPSFEGGDDATVKVWKEFFKRTRYWELEPWFDVDGGRALALEETEYIVYIEKPSGPVEVQVAKHGYEVYWIDPATGQVTKAKNYRGEAFAGEPPSKDHDWVLHLSRDGRKESLLKSYKFESRRNLGQEIEQNSPAVTFELVEPAGSDLALSKPAKFAVKLKRETRASRAMQYVWTGEVVNDGEGARILGLGPSGTLDLPRDLAARFPAVLNLRVMAINANGKAYALDKVYRLVE
ncbi:MAG: DUF5060 domain-containing protein [Bryobacteraceae bacterium]|nr:DUF5060 domain-containing protein [Bryobacteraceae bacterium]